MCCSTVKAVSAVQQLKGRSLKAGAAMYRQNQDLQSSARRCRTTCRFMCFAWVLHPLTHIQSCLHAELHNVSPSTYQSGAETSRTLAKRDCSPYAYTPIEWAFQSDGCVFVRCALSLCKGSAGFCTKIGRRRAERHAIRFGVISKPW